MGEGMFKWFGKMVAQKLVGLFVFILALILVYLLWHYRADLPDVGWFLLRCVIWLLCATALPWATFFLVVLATRSDSNGPAAVLLLFWAIVDALLAWWLILGGGRTAIGLVIVGLAFCLGGLYNLIAANQIAARLQRR
jgi:hypothetical protein